MAEKMVLSTSLLIAYENMAFEPRIYQKKYKRLMKIISLPYKTNKKQLLDAKNQGLNSAVYDRLLPQLCRSSDRDDTLEKLALKTSFKIILTEDKNAQLPYMYYRSPFFSNNITVSLKATDNRENFIKYLQMICSNATQVTICDNYFAQGWDDTQSLFSSVLPRHKLEIEFVETSKKLCITKNSDKIKDDFVTSICTDWSVAKSDLYQDSHDRYLLVNTPQGKIEVMLSSGFVHIWKRNPKEIMCVIREK